jgi:hypothetical protein
VILVAKTIEIRRAYRAGVVAGALSFIALLGVVKDLNALLDPAGRGEIAWGFLMVRYSSLQRVWFGYKLTGVQAWYATFPHLALYAAALVGLVGMKRWGWRLALAYLLYIPLSEWTYMALYPLGYLTGQAYPDPIRYGEWIFLLISFPLELLAAWLLWRYRDVFLPQAHHVCVGE